MSAAAAVRAFAADQPRWRSAVRHDADERTYELVHRDADVEVYVVSWMPGHDTGFHDHDDSAAAILVVEGSVVEERLGFGLRDPVRYAAGELVEVPAEAIHRVRHAGRAPAVTLHAYAPPLRRVGTYEIGDDGTLRRVARDAETRLEAPVAV